MWSTWGNSDKKQKWLHLIKVPLICLHFLFSFSQTGLFTLAHVRFFHDNHCDYWQQRKPATTTTIQAPISTVYFLCLSVHRHPHKPISLPILHTAPPLTVPFLINRKWANIFPVLARLLPHLFKLAHYVVLWLVEENQLFNSQTWGTGAGGTQQATHLIPRTLISYKASSNFPPPFSPNYCTYGTHHQEGNKELVVGVLGTENPKGCVWSILASFSLILCS